MTDSPDIFFSSEFPENEPEETIEKPQFTKAERILALITAVLAFGFVKLVIFNNTGFFTTALFIAIITASVIYLKAKGFAFSRLNKVITVVLYTFSLVFSVTANDFIKSLCVIFLFAAGAYLIYSVTTSQTDIERFLPVAMLKSLFELPFSKFSYQPQLVKEYASNSKFGSNMKMLVTGLVLTVPLTAVVGALLMSADDGLADMLGSITDNLFGTGFRINIIQLLIAIPCSCYLFGLLCSNTLNTPVGAIDREGCEEALNSARKIQNLVLYTMVTPICILYVMFFISQASYFLSAFAGSLPTGYSYSDYARQGFFELCAVTVINLTVIIFMSCFAKNSGTGKTTALKIYNTVLSVFTLILIATAVSKMAMYISVYGLTRLRVYTTWFMLLCAIIFVLIIISQYKKSFRIARWTAIAFTMMFALLCFSRPDALIAGYNIDMYEKGAHSELDITEIMSMSDDAVLTAVNKGAVSTNELSDLREQAYEYDPYLKYNISSAILSEKLS